MVNPTTAGDDALNEALSAVADGGATPADWARVNAAWARDPALRERWALWHAAGDGLRSAELPALHREPQALLAALHAQMSAPVAEHPRRRDWFAPLAVAAGFVAMAVGVVTLRPAPEPGEALALAPAGLPRAQALAGTSFAQAAAGPNALGFSDLRETGAMIEAPTEFIDWGPAAPQPSASAAQPNRHEAPRR